MIGRGLTRAADASSDARWIIRPEPRPRARLRLFCVPYAGGGASVYRGWPAHLPDEVEVCAVQLPGREGRYTEAPLTDVHTVTGPLCEGLAALLDRPFALFGHSLGAAIAYETARALRHDHGRAPSILFVSGHRAPHLPRTRPPIHHLPEQGFLEELRRLDGTPAEVFAEPDLLQILLPMLRADFRMAETYIPSSGERLDCPVVALGSTEDDRVSIARLEPWREVTTGAFDLVMLPGDHFYLKTHGAMLLDVLATHLTEALGRHA